MKKPIESPGPVDAGGSAPEGGSEYVQLPTPVLRALARFGLLEPGESVRAQPLAGGVSSDILLVSAGRGAFCIKRALPRLKVAALWEAPIERNAAEAAWLRTIGAWLPQAVPTVLGEDPELGLFAMAWLEPASHPVWKRQLLDGQADAGFAAAVGSALAQIHSRAAAEPGLARRFAHKPTFEPIRIEPYLRATALRHPDLATTLGELADTTLRTDLTLMHGDVSPKNILCGPAGPVFLDAECACFGDPAFDLAFCLNHLLLKGRYRPASQDDYLASFAALVDHYRAGIDWEPAAAFESRAARLLPALLLARIDGKSPVEYLTDEADRDAVRQTARALLQRPVDELAAVAAATRAWRHP